MHNYIARTIANMMWALKVTIVLVPIVWLVCWLVGRNRDGSKKQVWYINRDMVELQNNTIHQTMY